MFPEIVKKKKKVKIGTEQMQKQCEFILKQLDFRHRKALKSLNSELVSDFHKVCHLKDIPQFYWQYFFYFVARAPKEDIQKYFAEQVENIMLSQSYYHKISSLLKQRQLQLLELKQQMQIVQAFAIMNSGKQLPMPIKGKINSLINNCTSLEQLKSIESTQVSKIGTSITKLRDNLKEIIETVISWQFLLRSFSGSDASSVALKKMKMVFPENGVNCIFIGLYDMQFLKTSFLNNEIKFSNSQYDPFLTEITPHKKISKIFLQHLFNPLVQDKEQYQKVQKYLFDSIPLPQAKQQQDRIQLKRASTSQKKFHSVQRPKSKQMKRSSKKLLDDYVSAKLIIEKPSLKINPSEPNMKQINIDQITSVYKKKHKSKNQQTGGQSQKLQKSLNKSRQKSIEQVNQRSRVKSVVLFQNKQHSINNDSPKDKKSGKKKLQDIQLRPKSMSKTLNTSMKKIENVYKLSYSTKKPSISKVMSARQAQVKDEYLQRVLREKDELIKQLKNHKKQQQQLKKIIKQVQNRTSNEQKNFQQKTQFYQRQIQTLKTKMKQRYINQNNELLKDKKQLNPNKLVTKVCQQRKANQPQNQIIQQKQSAQQNLAKSQLIEKMNTNKMLENKIKLLIKQKNQLQKLIQKQGTKINKQKQIYERKMEKYQQMIDKLKNQAIQNKNLAFEYQKKYSMVEQTVKKQQREEKIMKLYAKRQLASSPQKVRKSEQKLREISSIKADKDQIRQSQKDSRNNNKPPILFEQDLKITNNRNTIQIVYNRKKQKNHKKQSPQPQHQHQPQQNNLNKGLLKQKQNQLSQLARQKSLLQRKLDMRVNEKSGHEMLLMRKLQQSQQKFQKYRTAMERQKQTTIKYSQKMKQLRKKINEQYQHKIQKQRERFERERQRLIGRVKEEKQSKLQKDKYLSRQVLFLKQMEMRERELVEMLERERQQREDRERVLQEEIAERQEMLQRYEMEEIKRVIEKQVREEMNLLQSQHQHQEQQQQQQQQQQYHQTNQSNNQRQQTNRHRQFESKKQQLQQQMRQLMASTQMQLQEMDQQNERLKQLIQKIKQEQRRVIGSLESGIVIQDKEEDEIKYYEERNGQSQIQREIECEQNRVKGHLPQLLQTQSQQSQQNQQKQPYQHKQQQQTNYQSVSIQLQQKSRQQLSQQHLNKSRLTLIQQSTQYKQRQKLQNIIQKYLQKPNHYPSFYQQKKIQKSKHNDINNRQGQQQIQIKHNAGKNLQQQRQRQNQRRARQFQLQLMELKNVQNYIPAERDDPVIMGHLLHLRQQYQHQQAEQLRKVLFPQLGDNQYQQNNFVHQFANDLSFQSSQPPAPVTLRDHVNVHQQGYLKQRKSLKQQPSKNFMAINRLRLMQIQQQKREKQRLLIEQQSKKKLRRIRYRSKKKEQKQLQQFNKIKEQLLGKQKRREQQMDKGKKVLKTKKQQKKIKGDKQQFNQKEYKGTLTIKSQKKQQVTRNELDNELDLNKRQNKQQQQQQQQQQFEFINQNEAVPIIDSVVKKEDNEDKDNLTNSNSNNNINQKQQQYKRQQQQKQQQQEEYDDQQFEDQFLQSQSNQFLPYGKQRLMKSNQISQQQGIKQQQQQLNDNNKNNDDKNSNDNNNNNIPSLPPPLPITPQQQIKHHLQQQKLSLKQDILSYQSQIRSYISSYTQYNIYQHYIPQKQLINYLKQLTQQLSSEEIIKLNNNQTLTKDLIDCQSVAILVAKDLEKKLQIGIGVFHKQYDSSEYICDYILAHDMTNFLPLVFNFTRFVFENDTLTDHVELIFTVDALKQEQSKTHFAQFEDKCKRLGEIYVKGKQSQTRKYVLKRELFEDFNNVEERFQTKQSKPLKIKTKLEVHQNVIKEKNNLSIKNSNQIKLYENFTPTFLLSLYLKNNPNLLDSFKSQIQQDLKYRQLLLTSMIFAKKQFAFKPVAENIIGTNAKIDLYKKLSEKYQIDDAQQKVEQLTLIIQQGLQGKFKRCLLEINQQDQKYCMFSFTEALNRCQATNSSEIGTFLPLIPKYKMLVIPAQQFLNLSQSNPDMNVFFYTKHFIKNISEVKKESISRVFLPEIKLTNWTFYKELSQKMKKSVFSKDELKIGYEGNIGNSVIYTPRHSDLFIQKPFIISILSANVERTVEGSPIFCTLVQ